jgi:chitinase
MFLPITLRNVLLAFVLGTALTDATQVMHRPNNYKDSPHKYEQGNSVPRIIHKRSGAKANIAYFTNWCVWRTMRLQSACA